MQRCDLEGDDVPAACSKGPDHLMAHGVRGAPATTQGTRDGPTSTSATPGLDLHPPGAPRGTNLVTVDSPGPGPGAPDATSPNSALTVPPHTRSHPGTEAALPKSQCPTSELQASLKIRLGVILRALHICAGAGCQERQVQQSVSHSGCARSAQASSAAPGAALEFNLAPLGCLLSCGVGQSWG